VLIQASSLSSLLCCSGPVVIAFPWLRDRYRHSDAFVYSRSDLVMGQYRVSVSVCLQRDADSNGSVMHPSECINHCDQDKVQSQALTGSAGAFDKVWGHRQTRGKCSCVVSSLWTHVGWTNGIWMWCNEKGPAQHVHTLTHTHTTEAVSHLLTVMHWSELQYPAHYGPWTLLR